MKLSEYIAITGAINGVTTTGHCALGAGQVEPALSRFNDHLSFSVRVKI